MRRSNIIIVSMLLLLLLPAMSLQGASQEDVIPFWNTTWMYRQELQLPIRTNDVTSQYQPIDLHVTFEKPCWTENENKTSIRLCSWYKSEWYELESQIYGIKKDAVETDSTNECNVIFLVPVFADGTERYFLYYNNCETPQPTYMDHVSVEDENYSSSPLPDVSAQAKFYGIKEDGYCIYGIGQEGHLLDRSCAQIIVKQKKDAKEFDLLGSDQIVSFAFSYYYGSKEKDESSSDQVFVDKKIMVDGNLMVKFGIITESKKKDIQTTVLYTYYYNPLEEKRINVHVQHKMLKDATVQGIDNLDGRFGSIISIKARSASAESLNFGEIYPYLNFYGENDKIEEYQMNQNPATKDREWIISFKNNADIGKEAWICYGGGNEGKVSAVLFASNEDIVTSGTDERDGIQLKVAEKEFFNFLGTEVDYASINFGRRSYEPGYSHDVMIPSDLIVQFDAEVFASDTGGYPSVQKESYMYQTLIKARQQSDNIPFEREQKRYNVTVMTYFGGTHFSYPRLENLTGRDFPVMWMELYQEGRLITAGSANRSFFIRSSKTFSGVLEGDYLVKVYWKRANSTKIFTGSALLHLDKNTKITVFCTWQRTIQFTFLDQHGQGISGIHGWLRNKDGVLFDENTTQNNGELCIRAPYNPKDPYTFQAEYKDFIVYDTELQKTLKKLNLQVNVELYNITVAVTDALDLPPGVELTPILVTSKDTRTIQFTPEKNDNGRFFFEGIPVGDYNLQIRYGDFVNEEHVKVPNTGDIVRMKFTALFDLTIDLFDSKGNTLNNNDIHFKILRDAQTVGESEEKSLSLPPAQYSIKAYTNEELIGVQDVELTNDRHLTFVTTIGSLLPVVVTGFSLVILGFLFILTLLKKFSISSLLKCIVLVLVVLALFQPWWEFSGSSITPMAEKNTAMYVNPGVMIDTTKYGGGTSLDIAEMPDVFLAFLDVIAPLALLVCLTIGLAVLTKELKKKQYATLLNIGGIILLFALLVSFYYGTEKLCETSIGAVQGESTLTVSIGSEEILMKSGWGFSLGFYFVFIAAIIAVIVLVFDIRARVRQKKKS